MLFAAVFLAIHIIFSGDGRLWKVKVERHMTRRVYTATLLTLAAMLLAGCKDDVFTVPAFVHVDGIAVDIADEDPLSYNMGFYGSDIVAAYVVAHYPGEMSVDTVGLFRLPFTTPLLYNGQADYIELYPAIEQSGISGTLPYYPFYQRIQLKAADSTTLRAGDTLDLGTPTTHYSRYTHKLFYASFDHDDGSVRFDSVFATVNNTDSACTGDGYGELTVGADELTKRFAITGDPFTVSDATSIVYLELDIRSDMRLQVYMHSAYVNGGSEDVIPVMVINPTDHWQHMYINLGRTWAHFNHHATFKLSFAALNTDGTGGKVRLDNVKLLTTNAVL